MPGLESSSGEAVGLVRAIGRWGLTWLVVNAIVGSAVFGLPTEYVKLLGGASMLAVVLGGLSTIIIIACIAEVASKFPEPGGSYIYAVLFSASSLESRWDGSPGRFASPPLPPQHRSLSLT